MTPERALDQIETAAIHWRRGSLFRRFAIRHTSRPAFQGTLQFHPKPPGGTVLDIWLCPNVRGRHLASSAVRLALAYAFDTMGVAWVEVEVRDENTASAALALRTGFQPLEATLDRWRRAIHRAISHDPAPLARSARTIRVERPGRAPPGSRVSPR